MIRRLLVANHGEIAHRIFRTCRLLGIETVAVYAADDAASSHVAAADIAVPLDAVTAGASYLDVAAIVAAMDLSGADAVHPGYGFLAESPALADAVLAAAKTFVGPRPATLRAGADKVEARRIVAGAGIPVLPGAEIDAGTDLEQAAGRLGFPLLIKARGGGGGRGMRLVTAADDIAALAAAAQREAHAAFGDGGIYLESLVAPARHLEVQILADHHGRVLHLGERECTIQRRHQKLLEEAPSISIDDETRANLLTAAVAAARAVDYTSAGTVEFMLDAAGDFFFIEFNTRLQVEHTVTEQVTGIDIVEQQLNIAAGGHLPDQAQLRPRHGHAIQARVYAEDPSRDFQPQPGPIHYVREPTGTGIRVDCGVESGATIGTSYDTLLMKVIAHGADRSLARRRLIRALGELTVHGPETTAPLLRAVLAHPDFAKGEVTTDFLDTTPPAELLPQLDPREEGRFAVAAALAGAYRRRQQPSVFDGVDSGWRNVPTQPQQKSYTVRDRAISVAYSLTGPGFTATVGEMAYVGNWVAIPCRDADGHLSVSLEGDGLLHRFTVARYADSVFVCGQHGSVTLRREPRFHLKRIAKPAGSHGAPLPGLVVATPVGPGTRVAAGDVLVVIEAMKLEHRITAAEPGTVTAVLVSVGDQVDAGTVLVSLDPEATDPSAD